MSHNFTSPSDQQPLTNSGTFTSIPKCHKESSKDLQQPSSLLPSHILGAWYLSAMSCSPVLFPVRVMVTAMSPHCCSHKGLSCVELSCGSIYSLLHYNLSKSCQEMLPCSHFSKWFHVFCPWFTCLGSGDVSWVLRDAQRDTGWHLPVGWALGAVRGPWGEQGRLGIARDSLSGHRDKTGGISCSCLQSCHIEIYTISWLCFFTKIFSYTVWIILHDAFC